MYTICQQTIWELTGFSGIFCLSLCTCVCVCVHLYVCVCVFVQQCLCLHCIMNSLSIIPATDNQTFLNRRQMCHNNVPLSQSDSEAVGIVARIHFWYIFFLFNWQTVAGWVLFIFTGMLRVRLCQTDTKHGYLVQWNRSGCRAEGSQQNMTQNRPLHVARATYHHCHVFVVNAWFKGMPLLAPQRKTLLRRGDAAEKLIAEWN